MGDRRRLGPLGIAGASLSLIVVTHAARSQPRGEPIRIAYDAPSACPSEDEFFAAVQARTERAQRALPSAPARTFVVHLTSNRDESSGRLIIRALDGGTTEREVTGDTCEEVVAALALITAFAVDPNASARPAPARAPVEISTPPPPPDERRPPPPPPNARRWRLAVSVDGSLAVGASPRPLWGVSPTFEADAPTGGSLSPTFHLGFDRASTGSVDLGGPTAAFTSTLGIAEGCPNRWTLGAWSFEPCARVEAGILQGQGDHVVEPRTDTHSWLAVGAVARAEWAAFRPIFVDFEGGFRVPVVRTTFFFEPYNVIYETAPVGGLIRAGLGVRFL